MNKLSSLLLLAVIWVALASRAHFTTQIPKLLLNLHHLLLLDQHSKQNSKASRISYVLQDWSHFLLLVSSRHNRSLTVSCIFSYVNIYKNSFRYSALHVHKSTLKALTIFLLETIERLNVSLTQQVMRFQSQFNKLMSSIADSSMRYVHRSIMSLSF